MNPLPKTNTAWDSADAYLFDIDGTLLNSRDGIHFHAFHHAVHKIFGVDSSIDGLPVHGNTDIGILKAVLRRAGVPDEQVANKLPLALQHMCGEVARSESGMRVELCPAIGDMLRHLHNAGRLLGVVTGNLEPIGWAKIRAAGLREYFAFGSFSDRNELRADIFRHGVAEARRRIGTGAQVCVVGDTPSDVQAAREVGIPVIAVATGIFTREQLLRERPDFCVGCCSELFEETIQQRKSPP